MMGNYKHGHKLAGGASAEYIVWNGMRARCNNPQNPNYPKYGGRGITVCERWAKNFAHFLEDMGACQSSGHSIDRVDNSGNYEPGNCRWATAKEQANNRRSSRYLTLGGQTATLAQWADKMEMSIGTLHARLRAGWSVEKAINEPIKSDGKKHATNIPFSAEFR